VPRTDRQAATVMVFAASPLLSWEDALRPGAAAGSLNVTRRGPATGRLREIERLAGHVELRPLEEETAVAPQAVAPGPPPARARPA
jgi:hypothetical protein